MKMAIGVGAQPNSLKKNVDDVDVTNGRMDGMIVETGWRGTQRRGRKPFLAKN
jgi:hypothetical protein